MPKASARAAKALLLAASASVLVVAFAPAEIADTVAEPAARPTAPAAAAKPALAPLPLSAAHPGVRPVCDALADRGAYEKIGYRVLRAGYGPWLYRDEVELRVTPPVTDVQAAHFAELTRMLKAKGVQLIVLIPPPRGLTMERHIDYTNPSASRFDPRKEEAGYRTSLARIAAGGAITPDVLATIRDPNAERLDYPAEEFFSGDFHWTPVGANYAAQAVRRALEANKTYQGLSRQAFETKVVNNAPFEEGFEAEFGHICHTPVHFKDYPHYETAAAGEGGGLLGDETLGFALVGTSFSRNATNVTNFVGFLSQHLESEVLNYAITGGGNSMAMLQYLGSQDFVDSKPKFLVWEFLYHDLPSDEVFRQIIGTLRGDCGKAAIEASPATDLKLGETPIPLKLPKGVGAGDRLILEPLESGLKVLEFKLRYRDGTSERVLIDGARWESPPSFVGLDLPSDGRELTGVSVVAREKAVGKIAVRACAAAPARRQVAGSWWRALFS